MSLVVPASPRQRSSQGSLGWRILVESSGLSAKQQMARDAALAEEAISTVRIFRWSPPAVSLGLKQKPPAWFNAAQWQRLGLEYVERPTGGGMGFHGSDISISVVVPRRLQISLDNLMDAVCQNALLLCESLGINSHAVLDVPASGRIDYCLMELSPYAVMIKEKKVAGFALRRFPQAWLIQGSLLVHALPQALANALPAEVFSLFNHKAVSLSEAASSALDESEISHRWASGWAHWWEETLLETLIKES